MIKIVTIAKLCRLDICDHWTLGNGQQRFVHSSANLPANTCHSERRCHLHTNC